MVFNDTTNNTGLVQYYELKTNLGLGSVSGTTAKLQEATLYMNNGLSKIWNTIFKSAGAWVYDDSNYIDLPQATATLTSGQSTYALPSSALTVRRLECKNDAGDYYKLNQIDDKQVRVAIDEFMDADGQPQYYRIVDSTIEIFPTSNYSESAGLKIYFDRSSVSFSYDDTTQSPGFASEYHYLVGLWASYEWKSIHLPGEAKIDREEFEVGLKDIAGFFGKREKDIPAVIRPKVTRYK